MIDWGSPTDQAPTFDLENRMKKLLCVLALAFACCLPVVAQDQAPSKTVGEAYERTMMIAESEFIPAADALSEDKYNFAPDPSQGEFKGVRTFAQQVKHVAAVNYLIGAAILQEKPPVELGGENGPDNIKSKAEITKFAKDSFEYAKKAMRSITDKNLMDQVQSPFGNNKSSRAGLAMILVSHPFDHYGQMAEYLRMNKIIPPASRGQ